MSIPSQDSPHVPEGNMITTEPQCEKHRQLIDAIVRISEIDSLASHLLARISGCDAKPIYTAAIDQDTPLSGVLELAPSVIHGGVSEILNTLSKIESELF